MTIASGYAHPAYADAVAGSEATIALPQSGGTLLRRDIPGTSRHDAAGCYPLFACTRWDGLAADLDALPPDLVSATIVTDPFGTYDAALLARCFPAHCAAYKEHLVTDLRRPDHVVSAHHRRNVRHAARTVDVERCSDPTALRDVWIDLYANLVRRHGIRGPAAFTPGSLAAQLAVPGIVALRADRAGETVGMTLWYEQDDVAYYHLGAYSDAGYAHRAAFAIFAAAIEHFRGRVRWLSLGAGAGATNDGTDGLTRFKRGWATDTRTAYLCGRIVDARAYAELAQASPDARGYFPVYRAPAATGVVAPVADRVAVA